MEDFNSNEIVKEYSDMIFHIALNYFKIREDAEDIVQEVLLKYMQNVVNKGKKFKSKEYEKYWLIRVTINLCCNGIKVKKKKMCVPLLEENFKELKVEMVDNSDLFDKINKLPEKYKEVLILHYIHGFKITDISKILNIGESNVKVRLKRAREKLKEFLDWS